MKTERYANEYLPERDKIIYRHINRNLDAQLPSLNLCIVCDEKSKEILLEIEPNHFFADREAFGLFWKLKNKGILGELNYRKENDLSDYLFASELIKFIDLGFEINYNGKEIFNPQSAQAFVETFEDYNFLKVREMNYF